MGPQVTARKLRVVTSADTYEALLEFIDDEHIPAMYGGKLSYGDAAPDTWCVLPPQPPTGTCRR